MNSFQKLYDQLITNQLSYGKVGALLIRKKLKEQGIGLTAEQQEAIQEQLQTSSMGNQLITIDVGDAITKNINFEIDLSDSNEIDQIINVINDALEKETPNLVDGFSKLAQEQLIAQIPEIISGISSSKEGFLYRLNENWGDAFDLLNAFIFLAQDAGTDFNKEFRPQAAKDKNYVFDALTRLHARSCQIAQEISVLLTNGFADGAHARWRSLHEIAVVGLFIKIRGNQVAERYLLHDNIELYKAATEFQLHNEKLGFEKITEIELAKLKNNKQLLLERFGKEYGESLGWAAEAFNNKSPKISDIEQAVGLEYLRPYYRLASHNVHANPKGLFFKLGVFENQELLLAGPSNMGLADPAQGTAISLAQITASLLSIYPNIDRLVQITVLNKWAKQIAIKFVDTQNKLENKKY